MISQNVNSIIWLLSFFAVLQTLLNCKLLPVTTMKLMFRYLLCSFSLIGEKHNRNIPFEKFCSLDLFRPCDYLLWLQKIYTCLLNKAKGTLAPERGWDIVIHVISSWCKKHASHMPVKCQQHAGNILVTCWQHANNMLATC